MKKKLNYECLLFRFGQKIADFQFHGDNAVLAHDHVAHCMNVQNANRALYRKTGAVNWKNLDREIKSAV